VAPIGKEVRWGDLGAFVEQRQVLGEAPHDGESLGKPTRTCILGKHRPRQSELGGDRVSTGRLAVGDELDEQAPGAVELVAE